jgi:hypothetical protein
MWKLHAIWFQAEVSNQFHAPVGSISVKEHVHAMTLAMVGLGEEKSVCLYSVVHPQFV